MGRRRDRIEEAQAELAAAEAEVRDARTAREIQQSRAPEVGSLAAFLRERRARNHFGRDFELTLTPRRRA